MALLPREEGLFGFVAQKGGCGDLLDFDGFLLGELFGFGDDGTRFVGGP